MGRATEAKINMKGIVDSAIRTRRANKSSLKLAPASSRRLSQALSTEIYI